MGFSYHDTVDTKGATLDSYEEKAKTQEEIILGFMRQNPGILFTPFDIMEQCYLGCKQPPITSIRRAITNLEHSFKNQPFGIRKSTKKKKGDFGRDNYCWVYVPQSIQKDLFQ